ncbi:RNase H domain-containing protein [Abeliophyllum distichum]|uniref:RNase H domain-containing protein n=1 Tax=Abeliophyllum distichum TaxID=126358 RepID=A0ABD1QTK2_9LAMI
MHVQKIPTRYPVSITWWTPHPVHERLSFLDAFFGYHQISMAELDQEKTSFITDFGTYCYTAIPFWLKNARATYQRMVNKVFVSLIGNVIEAYVDDIGRSKVLRHAIMYLTCKQVFDVTR